MIQRFFASREGAVAVATAVLLTLLVGLSGLGVEASLWYQTKRSMQGAADAAAVSAAWALPATSTHCDSGSSCTWAPGLHGLSVAAVNGWQTTGTNGVQVRVVSPPTRPGWTTRNDAVEVWITQPQSILFGAAGNIAAPTIGAYAIAVNTTIKTPGADCILALANNASAVLVHGQGDLASNCGIAIDGGRDQNVNGTPLGGIQFNGSNSMVNITSLVVASSSTGCPDPSHCFLFNSTTPLPASVVKTNTATVDPYSSLSFPPPAQGSKTVAISAAGSGYTTGTRTFTVIGGTGTATKFTATVSNTGTVTGILAITDPGSYTTMPTNPVSATPDTGGGTGAKFNLTQGCAAYTAGMSPPVAGRVYCSFNLTSSGTTNFAAGTYYADGGDACVGFCVSGANTTVTSDTAGVTFVLRNNARLAMDSGTVRLCAPGTSCGTTCSGSCVLFYQDPATATASTSNGAPANTVSSFTGNGTRTMSGLIYMPKQTFSMGGNSSIGGCTGVVAKYFDIGGTPVFSNGCLPGTGIGGSTITVSTLSE
jgi:hypothetical protein